MHELSFAQSVLDSILEEAEKNSAKRVKSVEIEMGDLALVTAKELESALKMIVDGTIAEGMEIKIEKIPVRVRCDKGHENEIEVDRDHHHMMPALKCPGCGGSVKVLQGNECILKKIIAE
ncbi:MAG: hydrogenase maturation nickel metallochaperone HypA [Candidatus Altiarchaeota archaeon]|nr:hydrogenase maturation nickel metallochaperone HypA [Candidatus Altiarchaeota archaeon]